MLTQHGPILSTLLLKFSPDHILKPGSLRQGRRLRDAAPLRFERGTDSRRQFGKLRGGKCSEALRIARVRESEPNAGKDNGSAELIVCHEYQVTAGGFFDRIAQTAITSNPTAPGT